ncbi:ketose-bisphosphate aldolase [symbiont of Argiope bruennichi]|uniref:class II fructose-bisphosphate aldolase n=1 Tax=symbiont of Argiope bruennichi TaxID=2810479 RepID=UPI003DA2EBC8
MYKNFNINNLLPAGKLVKKAFENGYAVPQFNVLNLVWAKTILLTCQEANSPVILGFSVSAIKYMGGYESVVNMVNSLIKGFNITIPVATNLDHGPTHDACIKAINAGFSSIMYDGSSLPIDENVRNTKKISDICKQYDISLEGEVGVVGGEEDGVVGEVMYAKIDHCKRLVEEGCVDILAASLGSVHGHYKGQPHLGFEKMAELKEKINVPLVLHGGSGIPDDMIKKSISYGESKINVSTELLDAFCYGIKGYFDQNKHLLPKGYDPRIIFEDGIIPMKKVLLHKINLFGSNNKG